MKKTARLYTVIGQDGRSYDLSSNTIEWDCTWSMQIYPYPPEPSYEFIIEDTGKIIKILEIGDGYFEALFYYVKKANLLNSDFGKVWFEFCWVGNSDDD